MAFCTKCGTQLSEGYAFCTNCGEKQEGQNAIVAPTGGAIEGKEMIPQSPETRQSRQAVIEKPTSTQAIGKNLVRGLLVLALIGVISAIAIPALLSQRAKAKQAVFAGIPTGKVEKEADAVCLAFSRDDGFRMTVEEFIVKYNEGLISHTTKFFKENAKPQVLEDISRQNDRDKSLEILSKSSDGLVITAQFQGNNKAPAWKNQDTYFWFWTNTQGQITMIKCPALDSENTMRALGIEEHDYYDSNSIVSLIVGMDSPSPTYTRMNFPWVIETPPGSVMVEYFKLPDSIKKRLFTRIIALKQNAMPPLVLEPTLHPVDPNVQTLQSGYKDWRENIKLSPKESELYGIPVKTINPEWHLASISSNDTLPAEAKAVLEKMSSSFELDKDINKDGVKEKLVVGVFETDQHNQGHFLLILKSDKTNKWNVQSIFTHDSKATFSVINNQAEEPVWNFYSTEGDQDYAVIQYKNGKIALEWVKASNEEGAY